MLLTSFSVLMPVLFVLALGYVAGRTREFDKDQVQGINELVLDFALPAIMFVSIVRTSRAQLFAEIPYLAAVLVCFLGLYLVVLFVSLHFWRHRIGEAALQACSVSFPSAAFMGIPIFNGLFGEGSVVNVTIANVVANVSVVPITVVLLEIHTKRAGAQAGEAPALGRDIVDALTASIKRPMVWAPLLAIALVLAGVRVPDLIDRMLSLIGSTTSGISLFAAGLVTAAYTLTVSREIVFNAVVKMLLQPLLMVGIVAAFAVAPPLSREAILLCAIPTATFPSLLAPRYGVYESECASTLVLTSLCMIVTLPIAIALTA